MSNLVEVKRFKKKHVFTCLYGDVCTVYFVGVVSVSYCTLDLIHNTNVVRKECSYQLPLLMLFGLRVFGLHCG
jgi:hypothetical protein